MTVEVISQLQKVSMTLGITISFEDYMLLTSIYELNENSDDEIVCSKIKWYYKNQVFYDREGENKQLIDWGIRLKVLEKYKLIRILPGVLIDLKEKAYKGIDLTKIEINENFVKLFKLDDIDTYWEYLVETYGRTIYVGDSPIYTNLPDSIANKQGLTTEQDIKLLFWRTINNGDISSYRKMIEIVNWMVESNSIKYCIARFLREYSGILSNYQKLKK